MKSPSNLPLPHDAFRRAYTDITTLNTTERMREYFRRHPGLTIELLRLVDLMSNDENIQQQLLAMFCAGIMYEEMCHE